MSDNHDSPDRGKHSDMMQNNAQRHNNDMGIKTRIAPTLLHSQQLLIKETFEALSFDSVKNESGDTRDEIFAMINITLEDRPHIRAALKGKFTSVCQETSCHSASSEDCTRLS